MTNNHKTGFLKSLANSLNKGWIVLPLTLGLFAATMLPSVGLRMSVFLSIVAILVFIFNFSDEVLKPDKEVDNPLLTVTINDVEVGKITREKLDQFVSESMRDYRVWFKQTIDIIKLLAYAGVVLLFVTPIVAFYLVVIAIIYLPDFTVQWTDVATSGDLLPTIFLFNQTIDMVFMVSVIVAFLITIFFGKSVNHLRVSINTKVRQHLNQPVDGKVKIKKSR